jgi:voltage-gated potassium channel
MTTDRALGAGQALSRAQRRRVLLRVLFRSLASAFVLVALFYVLPIQDLQGVHLGASLSVGLVILVVVIVWQVRAITHHPYPGLRAVEALALTAPLFLVLYATTYVVLAQDNAANFSTHQLTRTDALYFTLTVFSTVGFGDITATSQSARVFVMVQMVLDLAVLGLGVQVFRGAVSVGRRHSAAQSGNQAAQSGNQHESKDGEDHPEGTQS